MKGVMGILLIGGGVFLLIALFNGSIKFPLGNMGQGPMPTINKPGPVTGPAPINGQCPKGYVLFQGQCVLPGASAST